MSEPLENCGFVDPQRHSWGSSYSTQNNVDYLQIGLSKSTLEKTKMFWFQISVVS